MRVGHYLNPCMRGCAPPCYIQSPAPLCVRQSTHVNNYVAQQSIKADLSVVIASFPQICARRCKPLDFTVTVSNSGSCAAIGVDLILNISEALYNLFYSADGGVTWEKWLGSLDLGTLAANGYRQVFLREISARAAASEATLTAQVYSQTPDSNYTNNKFSLTLKFGKS